MVPLNGICVILFTVTMVAQCMRFAHVEDTSVLSEDIDENVRVKHDYHRVKRSGTVNVKSRQNCESWSTWQNTHTPTATEPNDREQVTQQELAAFCPPDHGGHVNKTECRDEKLEPFHGNQTSPTGHHFISCNNALIGMECILLQANQTYCPDLEMRYFCSCSNETSITSSYKNMATTSNHESSVSKHHSSANNTNTDTVTQNKRTNGFNAGRLFVPWWALNLFLTLILFSVCMCTTLCIYKHLQNKLKDHTFGNKISPTA